MSPRVTGAERDALLATKLHIPALRPSQASRARVTRPLDAVASAAIVLVCAPAGFGKSALLAEWARDGARPAAWLSLDAADNDPTRFRRHVLAAVDRAVPGLAYYVCSTRSRRGTHGCCSPRRAGPNNSACSPDRVQSSA
jgi:LuxR family maltose regulon positive regulatory protein